MADEDPWTAGLDAFAHGDYRLALEHFEAAKTRGTAGPAVHYNIAVCHFELGDFGAADTNFAYIAEHFEAMRALANYNRGLVAVEQERTADARRFFLAAYEQSSDEALRVLASTMLRRTQLPPAASTRLSGAYGAGAGHDDNIVLRDDAGVPVDTATSSPFVEAYGSLSTPVTAMAGLRFDASGYAVSYIDNSDFNQAAVEAGFAYRWRRDDWHLEVGLDAGLSTFGGERFDNSVTAHAVWDYALTPDSILRLAYRYADVRGGDSQFSGIDGSRQQTEIRYRTWWHRQQLDASYHVEHNDRSDPGVSAERDSFRLRYRFTFSNDWELEAGIEFRRSEYDELDPKRIEDRNSFSVGARRQLHSGWQLYSRYEVVDNDASDATFGYSRNVFTVSALKPF